MDIMQDIFGALPWLVACALSFYVGQKRRQWVDAPRSSEALKRELALREQLVARYDALARALGWEYRPEGNGRLGGWYPIDSLDLVWRWGAWEYSLTGNTASVASSSGGANGTVASQSTMIHPVRLYPQARRRGRGAPSTGSRASSPGAAASLKRKRARGSSTAGGRK